MYKTIKFRNKYYLINLDRILYLFIMTILLAIFVVGCAYVSTQEYYDLLK